MGPTVAVENTTATLAEDADTSSRIKVADILVTDDALGTNALSPSGPDAALFEIDPAAVAGSGSSILYLKAGAVLDHETNPVLDVTVAVDDATIGATPDDTADLSILVTNVNEPPTVALANPTTSLAENTDTSTHLKVADAVVTDDALGTNGLSLSGADAAWFEIEGTALYLRAGAALDYETNPQLDVTVAVDDPTVGATPDDTASMSIAITDVNEQPDRPPCTSPVDGATAVILTPTLESSAFSDPDAGDTHAATQWQVDDNNDFSSPIWDHEDTDTDKTHQAVPSGTLSYSTTYYWRMRHQDSQSAWSEWSDSRSFTVDRYSPVYRFWKPADNTHFFTIKESEKDKLINNYSSICTYEGVAYYAYVKDQPPAGTLPVYRFWKPSDDTHFYTIKESEKQKLIDNYSHMFTYEGPAYYAYGIAQHPLGTLPVYRFWKPSGNTHFFTIRESEKDKLIALFSHIVTFEGIAWYAYAA
jgi:hypothetical protein